MKNSNYREEDKPKPDEVPAGWMPLKATEKAQKGNQKWLPGKPGHWGEVTEDSTEIVGERREGFYYRKV